MIDEVFFYPPLAFGRIGNSSTPMECYHWGQNDISPRGSGKTTIIPDETFKLDEKGNIESYLPEEIIFKDDEGFRPVCPFFELWGIKDGKEFPITLEVLKEQQVELEDVTWQVFLSNLKPFHYTLDENDKIECQITIKGNDFSKKTLWGISNESSDKSILYGQKISLGSIQLVRPNEDFPELRIRFFPPTGELYGPTNLNEINKLIPEKQSRKVFDLPLENLIVNPRASWCNLKLSESDDLRTDPAALFGHFIDEEGNLSSLGLIDDTGDGFIRVSINEKLLASSRIVVTPPDFVPDRRPFTSIADGLKDRVDRLEVFDEDYVTKETFDATTDEIQDLMERILETLELMNLDAQNDRAITTNRRIARNSGVPREFGNLEAFPKLNSIEQIPLPLTQKGRQIHRRFLSLEVFEDKLRENPRLIEEWIREPLSEKKYYDRKMPPLMRGSDAYPMHITKRQYYLLLRWADFISTDGNRGISSK